jgi:hypothetical protein
MQPMTNFERGVIGTFCAAARLAIFHFLLVALASSWPGRRLHRLLRRRASRDKAEQNHSRYACAHNALRIQSA